MTIQQGKLLRQEAKEDGQGHGQNNYIFNSLDMKYLILIYFGHYPVIDKRSHRGANSSAITTASSPSSE